MAFPGTYNFSYYRGDTLKFSITPYDTTGTSFPLTGYSAIFTVGTERGSGGTKYSAAQGMTAEVVLSTNSITCIISPTGGRNLAGGTSYVYDVQITDGTSVYTILNGTITSTDDVTI